MYLLHLGLRFVRIAWTVAATLASYGRARLGAGAMDEPARERMRGEALADMLERLGATFIKFGQILGTRPDLLPSGYIAALARLHDRVPAAPFADVVAVLAHELPPAARSRITHVDPTPLAAASVAQVHRALLDDGREIAIKLQRPAAAAQIHRDLAILAFGARLLDVIPSVRLLSLPGAVQSFGAALRGQLDFRREADNNRRFARNFASVPDIAVPALEEGLCTARVLAMELVRGVRASEPEKVGGDRTRYARIGAECVMKMVFTDGFVHADLHPGNIMLTDDGRVVLLDLGLVAEIPDEVMRPWIETFLGLAQRDGKRVCELLYGHSPSVGTSDYAALEHDLVAYFETIYGLAIGEVEISVVVGAVMNILRRHRVQIDPVFTVVDIALLVAEGLGKQLDPTLDMMELARPYLMRAMLTTPCGRAPLRVPPPVRATSACSRSRAAAPVAAREEVAS